MKIYEMGTAVDDYGGLAPEGDVFDHMTMFCGKPMAEEWTPMPMTAYIDYEGMKLGDTPGMCFPVLSRRALDVLAPLIGDSAEILELETVPGVGEFYAVNVTRVLDVVDYEKSEYKLFSDGHGIMRFIRYEFRDCDELSGCHIFKIVDEPRGNPFVSEEFVKAVEENGLEGFEFPLVWDSEAADTENSGSQNLPATEPDEGVARACIVDAEAGKGENMNCLERNRNLLGDAGERFREYGKDLEGIIAGVKSRTVREVITRGEIMNPVPYYYERLGTDTSKGKILSRPARSDECRRYSLDSLDRPVMTESYSTFLGKFTIDGLFLYRDDGMTEWMRLSGGGLAVLAVFDNGFSGTELCLEYAGGNGCTAEEYVYDDGILKEIRITRGGPDLAGCMTETNEFTYRRGRLSRIMRICENGYSELKYTTKKPNLRKIRERAYGFIREAVTGHDGDFTAFGIDAFIGDLHPTVYINITDESSPKRYIFQWENEEVPLELYDYYFTEAQYGKCMMALAGMIIDLAGEGLLKDKLIYFHESSECVTHMHPEVKKALDEAGITVR